MPIECRSPRKLEDYFRGNLTDASISGRIYLSERILPTAAGVGGIHAIPLGVIERVEGIRAQFEMQCFV